MMIIVGIAVIAYFFYGVYSLYKMDCMMEDMVNDAIKYSENSRLR